MKISNTLNELYEAKTIVITGGSGYIGSALINKLQKYNCKIIRTSRSSLEPLKGVEDWVLNLEQYESWDNLVASADIIFHLSGNTSVAFAEENIYESLLSNLLPIINLSSASKKLKLSPRVVYASTATVYGITDNFPVDESQKTNPLTIYDLHKLYAEQELIMASNSMINPVILRLANVYGPSSNECQASDRGILNKITKMRLEGKNIQIYGDGNNLRDYVYIDDVVNAFLHVGVMKYDNFFDRRSIIFNIASGTGTAVKEAFRMVSNEVAKNTGILGNIENIAWPKGINVIEKRNFIASIASIKSLTEWRPSVSLEEGIRLLVNYYSKE
jgi:UDP-glucose 4-epimerase